MKTQFGINDYVDFVFPDKSDGENGYIVKIEITEYGIFYHIYDEVTENIIVCSEKQLRDRNPDVY